uniref:EF-hand domain-containing protein n=1 Tax=Dunaliella tertiolecta TaxID=3047 RepID=A0A7S3QJV5_DUNTE
MAPGMVPPQMVPGTVPYQPYMMPMPGAAPPMMPGYVVPDRFGLAPPPLIHDSPYVAVKPRGPLMGPKPGEGPPGPDFGDKHPGMFYHVPHKTTGLQGAANKLALAANPNIGMSPHKIFMVYYDPDIDGLDFDGFSQLLDHLEVDINEAKKAELFARFDPDNSKVITFVEFEAAYGHLQKILVTQTLKEAGMTKQRMYLMLAYAIMLLLLMFVFIFVGVTAFTGTGTVGAVINSILTAASGLAMNLKKADTGDKKGVVVKIGEEEFKSDKKTASPAPAEPQKTQGGNQMPA